MSHHLALSPTFDLSKNELDLISELLADKRSPNTRRAYEWDLNDFFQAVTKCDATPVMVEGFLKLSRFEALALVLRYKSQLIAKGLKEATINRRLAAVKALVNFARKLGKVDWTLADIKSEKVKNYRDTTGVDPDTFKEMLAAPGRDTLKGKRDYALLRLLWDNALRRGEVEKTNIGDLELVGRKLWIIGKGKGTQREAISLTTATVEALKDYLAARGKCDSASAHALRACSANAEHRSQPLFIALDRGHSGHRLTGTSIARIVQAVAKTAGIDKTLSPHRIRHSSITAALEATGGDVRRVQKLSRHANLDTLMIYDDNRRNHQGEISDLLAGLV